MEYRLAGYVARARLYESARSIVYRADAPADVAVDQKGQKGQKGQEGGGSSSVILKVLNREFPSAAHIARFRHEFEMMNHVRTARIPRAYALLHEGTRWAIAMEDIGAPGSLAQIFLDDRRPDVALGLELAVQAAQALLTINKAGVIHRDIKPHNLIYNPDSAHLQLIDFGLASRLSAHEQALSGSAGLEGTLPYLSPEQTGRMNCDVDYRTDFYSLGVVLFELLAGRLPFAADDAMGWIHRHIAEAPPELCEVNPEVPLAASRIVSKLLAKNKGDRYQSAAVLVRDLTRCRDEFKATGAVAPFAVAERDASSRFQVAQKLYGRAGEIDALLGTFERVAQGGSAVVLVSGYSGVGKSALIREVYRPLAARRGYFVAGKFEQFKRNEPLIGVLRACSELVQQVLRESESRVAGWRSAILEAVGENGRLLTELIPELELLIGAQPEVVALGGVERRNRLGRVFVQFFGVFARPEHPLVVFLDDLQWVDAASLSLVQTLALELPGAERSLLLIGAYRSREVEHGHPLVSATATLLDEGVTVQRIELSPLGPDDVEDLVADTLHSQRAEIRELARAAIDKTAGNPFFLGQFLHSLHRDGLLRFDHDAAAWRWDSAEVESYAISDNVVAHLVAQLRQLSHDTQKAMWLAACIGSRFDLHTLSTVAGQGPVVVVRSLWPAFEMGLVAEAGEGLALLLAMNDAADGAEPVAEPLAEPIAEFETAEVAGIRLKFRHDRVRQAAYQLIDEDQRAAIHWQIARLLDRALGADWRERCFELADHFNRGHALIADAAERERVVEVNDACGRRAMSAAGYAAAVEYLSAALAVSVDSDWQDAPERSFSMRLELAKALALITEYERADGLYPELLQRARGLADQLAVRAVQVEHYVLSGDYPRALAVGKQALALQGITLPDSQEETLPLVVAELEVLEQALGGRSLAEVEAIDEPMSASAIQLFASIADVLAPALILGHGNTVGWICAKLASLSLAEGHIAASGLAYSSYGFLLCILGNTEAGKAYGEMGMAVADRYGEPIIQGRAMHMYGGGIAFYYDPVDSLVATLQKEHAYLVRGGDYTWAGYTIEHILYYMSERSIEDALDAVRGYLPFLRRSIPLSLQNFSLHVIRFIAVLSDVPLAELGLEFAEREYVEGHRDIAFAMGFYYASRIALSHLLREPASLAESRADLQGLHAGLTGFYHAPRSYFHVALALLATYDEAPEAERAERLALIDEHQAKLAAWAETAESNFAHKYLLIEAEKKRVTGADLGETVRLYARAINSAHEHGFVGSEAIANECCGMFWLAHGQAEYAQLHLRKAHYLYQRWGAGRLVRDLEARHPFLTTRGGARGSERTSGPSTNTTRTTREVTSLVSTSLDASSAMKAAQSIAREVELPRLLSTMLDILLENAGAQFVALLLPEGNQGHDDGHDEGHDQGPLFIQALGSTSGEPHELMGRVPLIGSERVPHSIIQYVARTRSEVILADAESDERFAHDPYIQASAARSILCAPVLSQGRLVALIYLENRTTSDAFAAERLAVLELLSAQMAIALDNALLYRDLARHRDHLEELVEARTAELAEATERAEEARARAEVASQAKSEFLSNMSHELRTPLNGILGYAQILRRQERFEPVATHRAIDVIEQSGTHLLTLINDILDLSKIEARKLDLALTGVHLVGFIDGIVGLIRMRAQAKGLSFALDKGDGLPVAVMADETRLRQILLNLLGNAVKFTQRGEVALRVVQVANGVHATDGQDDAGAGSVRLRFEVSDTGVGIAEDQQARIFQPFEQAGAAASRVQGTGLGLAISHRLVQAMGGHLAVASEPGVGSRFWFEVSLPLVQADALVQHGPESRRIDGYRGERRTILVADDVAHNRTMLAELLGDIGLVVVQAADGHEAVARAREMRPHAVLMDMVMPGLTGEQASAEILREPGLSEVPIIVMSASVGVDPQALGADRKYAGFLAKPVQLDDLFALLAEHLALDWEFVDSAAASEADAEEAMLDRADLEALHELASMGDILGVGTKLEELSAASGAVGPFVTRLQALVDELDDDGLLAALSARLAEL